ncbi:hypothetical protein [Chachezhania sediminis]|uniref:hypothetical protein n=1 Tax=Chachezhania sediminis TaxID=2599291 RepID=UPI00131D1790|nr:hypothetical protein [Chachezhania sediminis]
MSSNLTVKAIALATLMLVAHVLECLPIGSTGPVETAGTEVELSVTPIRVESLTIRTAGAIHVTTPSASA